MRSGGVPITPALATPTRADLDARYRQLSTDLDAQQTRVAELGAQLQDAVERLQQCRADQGTCQAEVQYLQNAVRQAEERCRAAAEQVDQYQHSCQSELSALVPQWAQCNADRGLALWQDCDYRTKYRDQIVLACLQRVCEDNNRCGEALLDWGKACLRFMAAIMGNDSPISIDSSYATYFQLPGVLHNAAPEAFARLASAVSALSAKRDEIARRQADPFYAQKVEEEQARRRDDEARHEEALAAATDAEKKTDAAVAARDGARTNLNTAEEAARTTDQQRRDTHAQLVALS